jgi:hypothetical protein
MPSENSFSGGVLVISVDLELPLGHCGVVEERLLDETTGKLLALCDKYRMSATWGVADPVHSAATDRVRAASVAHEIAVLGDATWVGSQAGRARFAGELSRRVLKARAAGLPISTLIPAEVVLDDHLDLVVKNGITAVRGVVDHGGRSRRTAQPHALHFGLWEFPGSLRLPGDSRWLYGGGRGIWARRGLRRAAKGRRVFHLVVDAPRLGSSGTTAVSTLERVLQYADRLRSAERLLVATLAEVSGRLSQTRHTRPSRSILRAG